MSTGCRNCCCATSLQTVPDVIQAKKFEVVNGKGKVIVELSNNIGGGVDNGKLVTRNSVGQTLVELSSGSGAGGAGAGIVTTYNEKGLELVELIASENGYGLVVTNNRQGQKLVQISSYSGSGGTEAGMVTTYNEQGQVLVELGGAPGGGLILTQNGIGQNVAVIGAGPDRDGMVLTLDREGLVTSIHPNPEVLRPNKNYSPTISEALQEDLSRRLRLGQPVGPRGTCHPF